MIGGNYQTRWFEEIATLVNNFIDKFKHYIQFLINISVGKRDVFLLWHLVPCPTFSFLCCLYANWGKCLNLSVAVHHVCDVGSSAGVSPFIEHDNVSKCVPLPILKRRMIQLFKSCVTFLRVSDKKKNQMGYNNPFEILSLSAKKIVPLPRLKRRKIVI